jgi:hypothetical protein
MSTALPLEDNQPQPSGVSPLGSRWQPHSTYTYINNRLGLSQDVTNEAEIANSGTMDDVPLFNFENPFFASTEGIDWVSTQRVLQTTLESNKQEVIDAIGNSSSLLTGYPDDNAFCIK